MSELTAKYNDVYDLSIIQEPIYIIGCGAIGSTLATLIARMGADRIILYDADVVEGKNIGNQAFTADQVGKNKALATKELIKRINPECRVNARTKFWTPEEEPLAPAYAVFCCVDSMEVRKDIFRNVTVDVDMCIDIRMGLTNSSIYSFLGADPLALEWILNMSDYTTEEALEATERSACGETLSFYPTVLNACTLATANFINHMMRTEFYRMILSDCFSGSVCRQK